MQASGVALEDQHRVIHVAVGAVVEAELLLAMRGIVSGIDIQEDLAAPVDLLTTETNALNQQCIVQAHQVTDGRRIFPAADSRLGAERLSQFLIGDDL